MPAILIPVAIFLGSIAASLVGRVLLALGVGFAVYKGADLILDKVKAEVFTQFGSVTADVACLLSALSIDKAITVIISAYAAVIAINAAMGANRRLSPLPSE